MKAYLVLIFSSLAMVTLMSFSSASAAICDCGAPPECGPSRPPHCPLETLNFAAGSSGMPAPLSTSLSAYRAVVEAVGQNARFFQEIQKIEATEQGYVVELNGGCEQIYSISIHGGSPVGGGESFQANLEESLGCS